MCVASAPPPFHPPPCLIAVRSANLIAPVKVNDIPYIGGESSMGRSVLRASSPMMKFGSSARKTLETPFFVTPGPNYDLPTFLGSTSTAVKYKPPAVPLPRKKKQVYTTNETSSMGSQVRFPRRRERARARDACGVVLYR